MRPLKLTLTAFGPYHETEIIDFEALKPYDLFVIAGNTGAGKTSIFDGISYALFGGASGEDRKEALSLRSDFAPDELPTTAELLFSLRSKTYRVFRQLPYLKSGNKTVTPGKAELYEIDRENQDLFGEINAVDRQITSEVDKKIFELLGLNKAQFNQLVMLPQGEYQRFLTSSTQDKEAILRTVFNTGKYQTLIDNLKLRRDTQNQKVIQLSATQTELLRSLYRQLPARDSLLFSYQKNDDSVKTEIPLINPQQAIKGLKVEEAHYQQELETTTANISLKNSAVQKLQTTIAQAESINQAFEQLRTTEQTLLTHQQSAAEIQTARSLIELAEKAQPLEKPYETVIRLRDEAKTVLTKLKQSEKELQLSEETAQNAQTILAQEIAKEAERTALSKEIVMLENHQSRIESLATHQSAHQKLTESQTALTAQQQQKERTIAEQITRKEQLSNELDTIEKSALPAFSLSKYDQQLQNLEGLFTAQKERESQLQTLTVQRQQDQKLVDETQAQYDQAYQTWLSNQASILAKELKHGDSCPVCGSTEHPALAVMEQDHLKTDQTDTNDSFTHSQTPDFTEAQTALMSAKAQYQQTILQQSQLQKEIEKQQPTLNHQLVTIQEFLSSEEAIILKPFEFPALPNDFSLEELQNLQEIVKNAGNIANKSYQQTAPKRAALKAHEIKLAELQNAFETEQKSLREIEKALVTKTAEISAITATIPPELHDINVFKKDLAGKQKTYSEMKIAFETAQKSQAESDKKLAVLTHQVASEKNQIETLINAGKNAKKTLDEALINAGFTIESEGQIIADESAFIAAQLDGAQIREYRTQIHQYEKTLEVLKQQIQTLKERLKDQKTIDLTELQTSLRTEEAALKSFNETALKAQHFLKIIQEAILQIEKNRESLEKESDHLRKIVEVYDLLRGDNPQKLSFERFILIAYFEEMIEAANLRLQKMTNGQFEFTRSENLASHGKQSGLDLDIYDAYTGEARDVKTLSGGEKFKASLSLSLGMADTIQAHQGGISIDTLFIDEGFGSLDEESLLQALDVLIELQDSGKMIGVISHVEELKQTLPARIEVTKTKGGFSKTKIITQDSE